MPRKLANDERGTTAIEFAMVIGPFLFLLFGIISTGFYFFIVFSLEHAVESAARVIRTGQAQTQQPNAMTATEFKSLVCAKLPSFMDCAGASSKIRIHVENFGSYDVSSTQECIDSGTNNLIATTNQAFNMGGASTPVLVTVCYEWESAQAFVNVPYWISPTKSKMNNGSTLIRASTAFTTEPYN
jgi:Flp pilus assembly protein TadG